MISQLLAISIATFLLSTAPAPAAAPLRLGFSGATATQLAGTLAIEQKLFDIYGVNVEFVQSAGTTMIRALDARSLGVAIVGGGQAFNAYLKGLEVRIIGGLVNGVPYQLWSKPEITHVKELKGKMIANTPPGTSLSLASAVMLQRLGFDAQRDVKLIAFGRIGLISQSLFTGVVDAALLSPPETIEARKAGMRMLLDLATARIPCPFTSIVTTRAVLEKSPAALERILKGITHGVKLAITSPEIAKKTISKHMRLSDPEVIDEVYQRVISIYERVPRVPNEAIDTVIKLVPPPAGRNPYGVLDMSLVERIEKEGLVKALYATK